MMYPVENPRARRRRKAAWILTALLLLLLAAVAALAVWEFTLVLEPNGEDCVLDYGARYEDPGAVLLLRGEHILRAGVPMPLRVAVHSSVDTVYVGTYKVEYTAKLLWWKWSAQRQVRVVDRIPPEITLVEDSDPRTPYGEPYQEVGFSAWDEYDGDLTACVICREENGAVHYSVTDSSGNRAEATREIAYYDPVPPQINLAGGDEISVPAGRYFTDPGYTAADNYDGDVTEKVEVSGEVTPYLVGTYMLTYTVTDSNGNQAAAQRTVIVEPVEQPPIQVPGGKVIYLTFDDGPCADTGRLLDILGKYNIKATFFVLNRNPDMIKRIVAEGHSIGLHSASHNYRAIYASEEAFFEELYRVQDAVYELTGVRTTLMRFPGGSSNTVSRFNKGIMTRLTKAAEDQGFQYFDWNVDSNDAGGAKDSTTVYANVINGVQRQRVSVVLQHDVHRFSVDAVERIIQWGLANGYTFLPLEAASPNAHHGVNN